jgi:nickel transport protein
MRSALVFAIAALLASVPVHAHKVVASVWADGDSVEGEVGLSNGTMAPAGTPVEVLGPNGEKLGETTTDGDGLFRYTPTQAVTHVFRADLGAGHVAQATLAADELPIDLIRGARAGTAGSDDGAVAPVPETPAVSQSPPALEGMIAEAVRREIKPLRKELTAYKEKNDMQSILGGLGYICGIFGLAFFLYARRGAKI